MPKPSPAPKSALTVVFPPLRERFRALTRDTGGFLVPMVMWSLLGLVLLATAQKGDVVLWVNARHQPIWDGFFRYATYLGDGLFWFLLLALLAARYRRFGLLALLAAGVSALVVQGLKNMFDVERPMRYLVGHDLHFVPGVDVHGFLSFPSGHTGAAFTGFFLLAAWSRRPWVGALCFVGAALAGFSRIYLVQHFLADVLVGSLLGVLVAGAMLLAFRGRGWFRNA